ncbi:hypothetical protein GSI_02644 [Ganoderma sinense ZZ0214-1]|uniref:Uncharacterized protein n=1 Tax=Ganoderma sinense ZZ0214-1 TaxID=1077348 RepID=A0A2G8SM63_9APHY|nr:hypothetical protein GSI_02644 [Ganoderma sinense ZZ0214-1]
MADVPTTSQPQPRSKPSRPRPAWVDLPPNPEPTLAFGFVLDQQCRLRWAHYFLNELEKDKGRAFTTEEREQHLTSLEVVIMDAIPGRVYDALPDVPRVRPDLLLVAHKTLGFDDYVFALRDNSTHKRLHAPLTKEHIEAVRKELGLPEGQQPKWVRVPVYVRGLLI